MATLPKSGPLPVVKIPPVSPERMIEMLHQRSMALLRQGRTYEAIETSKAMLTWMRAR